MSTERKHFRVYTKTRWADAWTLRPYLEALSASIAVPPAIGQAAVRYQYGIGAHEDGTARVNGTAIEDMAGKYVAITQCDDAGGLNEKLLFVGIVPQQAFAPLGISGQSKAADQVVTVMGIEWLLAQDKVYGAFVTNDGSTPLRIDRDVEFNNRLQNGRIEGNRSDALVTFPGDVQAHAFDGRKTARKPWSIWDILRYEIKLMLPAIEPVFKFPVTYYLGKGSRPAEIEALARMQAVYSDSGKSLWQILSELISPARGMRFGLRLSALTGDIEIHIWSVMEEAFTVGGVTIPAHDAADRQTPDLWSQAADDPKIMRVESNYDKIIVRGQPIKVCGTFYAGLDLVRGWTYTETDNQQTAYAEASKNTTGYSALSDEDKKIINDVFRSSAIFEAVWSAFVVPEDWDWKLAGTDILNPLWETIEGRFDLNRQGAYWNAQKRFLPWIPFKEGWDYSGPEAIDKTPDGGEDQYRKLFAVGLNDAGQYVDLSKCKHAANVQPTDSRLGVAIRFNPAHLMAKNNWDDAEPSGFDDSLEEFGFDWESLMVTAMIESDQVLAVEHTIRPEAVNIRELKIDVPWAELWRADPLTIVDIDAAGDPVFLNAQIDNCLRDDRQLIKEILAAASAFYSRSQYRLSVATQNLGWNVSLGTMLVGLDVEAAAPSRGGCISAIAFDFTTHTMSVSTESAELDITGILGMTGAVTGTGHTATRRGQKEITEVRRQVQELRQDVVAMAKGRPSQGGGGSDISRVFCKAGASTGNTIVCYTENPYPRKWDATVTFASGDIVCVDRTEKVYVSLQGSNINHTPASSATWWKEIANYDSTVVYADDELVFGTDGLIYQSQQADNENYLLTDTDYWLQYRVYAAGTTYALGEIIHGPDGYYYTSLQAENVGHTPASSTTWWQVFASITVTCKIYEAGENLIYCTPKLATTDELKVVQLDGLWRSLETFTPICGGEA